MRRKVVLLILLCMLAVGCFSNPVCASPPPAEEGISGEAGIESTLYLASWDCKIALSQGNTVVINGFSEAIQNVDKIWVRVYLQKWNGSNWVDVSSGYYKEENNNSYVTASLTLTVTPGNYYRTRSQHQCVKGGVKDPSTPVECVSQYIYISK